MYFTLCSFDFWYLSLYFITGLAYVCEGLKEQRKGLVTLVLWNNQLTHNGMGYLAAALVHTHTHKHSLHHNYLIMPDLPISHWYVTVPAKRIISCPYHSTDQNGVYLPRQPPFISICAHVMLLLFKKGQMIKKKSLSSVQLKWFSIILLLVLICLLSPFIYNCHCCAQFTDTNLKNKEIMKLINACTSLYPDVHQKDNGDFGQTPVPGNKRNTNFRERQHLQPHWLH